MTSAGAGAARMPLEYQLVLCCACTHLDPERAARVKALLKQDVDWPLLVGTGVDQGVAPLLYVHLNAVCPEAVPQSWLEYLRGRFESTAQRNLHLTAQLLRILEVCETNGILAIPYKGPVLAALAYGSLALREFADLDLVVRHRDLPRVRELLKAEAYTDSAGWQAAERSSASRVPGQYLFVGRNGSDLLEVHTERTLRYFPTPLDLDRFEQRLEHVSLGAQRVRTFSLEDQLLVLCVHGAKDFWNRLRWICDIAELTQLPRSVDWGKVRERARWMGVERMLDLGLHLADNLLGARLPNEVSRRVQQDAAVHRLAAFVRSQLFREPGAQPDVVARSLFRFRTRGNAWDALWYFLRLAMTPTEQDWLWVPLPAFLSPLYYALRPLRLLRKYGVGLVRRPALYLGPFEPTPPAVVERMLALGEVGANDVLYDLGCGDGRIVVTAAERFGIRCVGVDLDPLRIAEARANARRRGVEHLVRFLEQDAEAVELSEATVVTLYLTFLGTVRLQRRLAEQLRPGARIVSRDTQMPGWLPEKKEKVEILGTLGATLYMWRIGAALEQPSRHVLFAGAAGAQRPLV